jgi:hypothetical protein
VAAAVQRLAQPYEAWIAAGTRSGASSGRSSRGRRASKGRSRSQRRSAQARRTPRRAPAPGRRPEERMGGCAESQGCSGGDAGTREGSAA